MLNNLICISSRDKQPHFPFFSRLATSLHLFFWLATSFVVVHVLGNLICHCFCASQPELPLFALSNLIHHCSCAYNSHLSLLLCLATSYVIVLILNNLICVVLGLSNLICHCSQAKQPHMSLFSYLETLMNIVLALSNLISHCFCTKQPHLSLFMRLAT